MPEYLGEFEQVVLLAVLRLGKGAYGVPSRREIEGADGAGVSVGALYSTLDRLESQGLPPLAVRRGHPADIVAAQCH